VCSNKGAHARKIQTGRTIQEHKIPHIFWQALHGLPQKKFAARFGSGIALKGCKLHTTRDEVNVARCLVDKGHEVSVIDEGIKEGASAVIDVKPLTCTGLRIEIDKEHPPPLLDQGA